jgi:hypothetical protein
MMLLEAQRDGRQKVQSLELAVRASGEQTENIPTILEDSMEEWKEVAWIRIFDADGKVVAASATPGIDVKDPIPGQPRRSPFSSFTEPEIHDSAHGRLLISRYPFLAGPPPGRGRGRNPGPRSRPGSVEIALILDSVSTPFGVLRIYLIVGVSAALALMGALIVIRLRFPYYIRGQQIEGQLELARHVQADLLPTDRPISPNLDFATQCVSAWEVGGDFCDVFNVPGSRTAIVLGDVSGKGISAALLMALIHGAIHSSSWTTSPEDHENATRELNLLLCKKTARERFASLFWGWFDPKNSVLRYINAGHLPPLLVRTEDGQIRVQRLETGGPVLGLLPDIAFQQGELFVKEGDLLVAFSDGVVEAIDPAGEEFGDARVLDAIRESFDSSPADIRTAILDRLRTFIKDAPVHDDETLVVVRFKHAAARLAAHGSAEISKALVS